MVMRYINGRPMLHGRFMVYRGDLVDAIFGGGDSPSPPDYGPIAAASKESAEIAAALGREQLAEGKRQYDLNRAAALPIVDAQTRIMNETARQGADYFEYMKTQQRPVESALNYEAMGLNADEIAQVEALRKSEDDAAKAAAAPVAGVPVRTTITVPVQRQGDPIYADNAKTLADVAREFGMSESALRDRFDLGEVGANDRFTFTNEPAGWRETPGEDGPVRQYSAGSQSVTRATPTGYQVIDGTEDRVVESAAPTQVNGTPSADRSGSTALMTRLSSGAATRGQEEAANRAVADARKGQTAAANMIARQGIRYGYSPDRMAKIQGAQALQAGLSQASASNAAREREKGVQFAKKMDVAGLYRGLPGASAAAYNNATGAGNSAVSNQMAPSNAYMAAIGQGVNTQLAGQQMRINGLGSILNAQTSVYNNSGGDDIFGSLGSIMGGAAQMKMAFSDPRLKDNIVPVGRDDRTGLNLYEFNYRGSRERLRGVMADEVKEKFPEAVLTDDHGYMMVDYGKLGLELQRVEV